MLTRFCMTVIGIGYLFPISAIWAAFDYWKLIFPEGNIEFEVSCVYQVGSVVTVAFLSFSPSFSWGPRIYGGFSGQFVCLACILAFRWLHVEELVLKSLLMVLVALCSVATGYLDSALLSLCSQYSSDMQSYLQIGIGLGTLVSVLYRDATKLLMPGNITDATTIYFAVALVTVLVCVACYRLLIRLPESTKVAAQMRPGYISPACSLQPENYVLMDDRDDGFALPAAAGRPNSFRNVWRIVWRNQTVIFLNLFLTTLCYPGLITSIGCRQMLALRAGHWFQTLLLTAFTAADILGRFMLRFRMGLNHKNIQLVILIRACVFPMILWCITSPSAPDAVAFAVVSMFGFLNGYCVSLSLVVINEIPGMSDSQKKANGRISACSVNSGLCAGSVVAAIIAPYIST